MGGGGSGSVYGDRVGAFAEGEGGRENDLDFRALGIGAEEVQSGRGTSYFWLKWNSEHDIHVCQPMLSLREAENPRIQVEVQGPTTLDARSRLFCYHFIKRSFEQCGAAKEGISREFLLRGHVDLSWSSELQRCRIEERQDAQTLSVCQCMALF